MIKKKKRIELDLLLLLLSIDSNISLFFINTFSNIAILNNFPLNENALSKKFSKNNLKILEINLGLNTIFVSIFSILIYFCSYIIKMLIFFSIYL